MEEAAEPALSLVDLLQATADEKRVSAPDLTSPAAAQYLDQLQSLSLKSLLAEATVISSDTHSVESELTNLCFREYPTFISVHRCSAAVTSAFDDFSESLGRLLDAVPALEDECRTFVKSTAGVQAARAKAALVQEHQDRLFDLLEIPQLMDTCVRNGCYQEALELSAHTASMARRYPGVELVQDVVKEVDTVQQLMLSQLMTLLREPIKLPALVKTVGYLRRLGTVEEEELGLVFLISRLANFKTQLAGLDRDRPDPVRYVRKYVDLFREHVFDIVSQFTAIFLDGNKSSFAASQLASFVGQCVNDLVTLVQTYVPKMSNDAASLSSILVQLGYCALAFARVGLDFAALVTEPFSTAVSLAFNQSVEAATNTLFATIQQAEKTSNPSSALIAPDYLSLLLAADSPHSFVEWEGSLDALPSDLARFPPLAILVNGHLTALNSLRLLAPIHLFPALSTCQSNALLACTHSIGKFVRQAVALSDPLAAIPPGQRPSHNRAGSGRAHLLRRNSETQLTPEARVARRRETQRICIAFTDTWVNVVVPLLRDALARGVYELERQPAPELQESLDAMVAWMRSQEEIDHSAEPSPNTSRASSKRGSLLLANGSSALPVHDEVHDEPEAMEEKLPDVFEDEQRAEAEATAEAEADEDREIEELLASAPAEAVETGEAVEGYAVPEKEAATQPALESAAEAIPSEPAGISVLSLEPQDPLAALAQAPVVPEHDVLSSSAVSIDDISAEPRTSIESVLQDAHQQDLESSPVTAAATLSTASLLDPAIVDHIPSSAPPVSDTSAPAVAEESADALTEMAAPPGPDEAASEKALPVTAALSSPDQAAAAVTAVPEAAEEKEPEPVPVESQPELSTPPAEEAVAALPPQPPSVAVPPPPAVPEPSAAPEQDSVAPETEPAPTTVFASSKAAEAPSANPNGNPEADSAKPGIEPSPPTHAESAETVQPASTAADDTAPAAVATGLDREPSPAEVEDEIASASATPSLSASAEPSRAASPVKDAGAPSTSGGGKKKKKPKKKGKK